MCRNPKEQLTQQQQNSTRQNNVNQTENVTENGDDDGKPGSYVSAYREFYNQVCGSTCGSISEDDYVAAISSNIATNVEPLNITKQFGNVFSTPMIESNSASTIINRSVANKIIADTLTGKCILTADEKQQYSLNQWTKFNGKMEFPQELHSKTPKN